MSQCAVWEFRANEDYYDSQQLINFMKAYAKKYVFQKETGDSGYIHWQGRFSLVKKRTKSVLMGFFDEKQIKVPNYLEPTTNKEHQSKAFYVMKEDTRTEGPYMDTLTASVEENYIPKQFRNITLYQWQQQIIDSRSNDEFRKINMIYDERGNRGKSTLASIAELKYGAIDMPPLNDYKELVALLCNICMDGNIRDPKMIFVDMPRAMKKDQLNGMYSAIEQIKKGKLYDVRHHYKQWWIDSPQVWVFSNILPDMNFLSLDRWKIWCIKDDTLVPYQDEY